MKPISYEGRPLEVVAGRDSRTERERDAEIERKLVKDGRPLGTLVVVAVLSRGLWTVRVYGREHFLLWADVEARKPGTHPDDGALLKRHAAWIRGLPPGVCPAVFDWGARGVQVGTFEREPSS